MLVRVHCILSLDKVNNSGGVECGVSLHLGAEAVVESVPNGTFFNTPPCQCPMSFVLAAINRLLQAKLMSADIMVSEQRKERRSAHISHSIDHFSFKYIRLTDDLDSS